MTGQGSSSSKGQSTQELISTRAYLHPSPESKLPSSQLSEPSRTPSPQAAFTSGQTIVRTSSSVACEATVILDGLGRKAMRRLNGG